MAKALFFELLKRQLLAMTYEVFTVENVQAVFQRLLRALKAKAAETSTELDDWIVKTIENLANDTNAVERFVKLVRGIIEQSNLSGVSCGAPKEDTIYSSEKLETGMAMDFALLWGMNTPWK
ncbi:MAG: hypothetical protein IJK97_00755 [Thermoguttaceae bacterium]|nr:hypothetical protein [Thermoguttaceae bacterium]MBR0190438.1 hypothetical protein [Thermoguttaceae bacterium]